MNISTWILRVSNVYYGYDISSKNDVSSTRKYDNDGYHSDIKKMVTDFAGDMLCTYAEGREHDAFTNFEIPKAFKKLGIQLGHHLKDRSKKLDDYRKLVSNCVNNGTSYVRSLMILLLNAFSRDHFMDAPNQWETMLHRVGTFTKWSLIEVALLKWI